MSEGDDRYTHHSQLHDSAKNTEKAAKKAKPVLTSEDPISNATAKYMFEHPEHKWADCVMWILAGDCVEERRKRWFYDPKCKYFVISDPESGFIEFYIMACDLEHKDKSVETKIEMWSLGYCQHLGTKAYSASGDLTDPPIDSSQGTIVQILAVENVKDKKKNSDDASAHLQEVMRRQALHCSVMPDKHPYLPAFGVLRSVKSIRAEAEADWQTEPDVFRDAIHVLQSEDEQPWKLINRCFSQDLIKKMHSIVDCGLDWDGDPEILEEDLYFQLQRLPNNTDASKVCPWRAAAQGQESASIPPGRLYRVALINGTRFELYRER